MRLYLSSQSPWNSTYSTEEGHLLYKVECPWKLSNRKATIYRALPDLSLPTAERQLWEERHYLEYHPSWSAHPELDGQGSGAPQDDIIVEQRRSLDPNHEFRELGPPSPTTAHTDLHPFCIAEKWVQFADIEFHTIQSTRIHIFGEDLKASEFFKKEGSSLFKKNRIFAGWDGKQYRWELGQRNVQLYQLPDTDTASKDSDSSQSNLRLVAEYHPAHWNGHRRKATPPFLEVFSAGEQILDLLLVAFIYVEKLRAEHQTLATSSVADPPARADAGAVVSAGASL